MPFQKRISVWKPTMHEIGECGLYSLALKWGSQRRLIYVLFLIMFPHSLTTCDAGTLSCFTKTHYNLKGSHRGQAMTNILQTKSKSTS